MILFFSFFFRIKVILTLKHTETYIFLLVFNLDCRSEGTAVVSEDGAETGQKRS